MSKKGYWLNTTKVVNPNVEKPCVKLQYCPYGQIVEEFGFTYGNERGKMSCHEKNGAIITFGHDCPVHYLAEFLEEGN